jgi:hypothetical protein
METYCTTATEACETTGCIMISIHAKKMFVHVIFDLQFASCTYGLGLIFSCHRSGLLYLIKLPNIYLSCMTCLGTYYFVHVICSFACTRLMYTCLHHVTSPDPTAPAVSCLLFSVQTGVHSARRSQVWFTTCILVRKLPTDMYHAPM